MFITLM